MTVLSLTRTAFLCATLLAIIPACTSISQQQSVKAYVADAVVTSRVKAALIESEEVSGYAIEVDTYNQVVQLSGFVKTHSERLQALKLAKATKGVIEVRDALIVQR